MEQTSNISPLRYPGGKTRACKILETIMKEHFDISDFDNLISPFFGGGSFEFYIQNKYALNIIANDNRTRKVGVGTTQGYYIDKCILYNTKTNCKRPEFLSEEEIKILKI